MKDFVLCEMQSIPKAIHLLHSFYEGDKQRAENMVLLDIMVLRLAAVLVKAVKVDFGWIAVAMV